MEGPGDKIWQKMTVYSAFLSLPIWLFLGPHVSSGNMPLPKVRHPSHLLPCGEQKALVICLKACQELAGSGDQGRDAAYHLIRKASAKGLWLKKLLSNFPLHYLVLFAAVRHLTDGLSWCRTKPGCALFFLHHGLDCSWQGQSSSPFLLSPPVPSPQHISVNIFSQESRAIDHG